MKMKIDWKRVWNDFAAWFNGHSWEQQERKIERLVAKHSKPRRRRKAQPAAS